MDAKQFGAFIAQRRKEKNMTQADLAERLHVTDKAISRWERGKGFPDINTIEPLANVLDLSVLELMKTERNASNGCSGQDAIDIMRSAAELAAKNRKQELTATALAIFTTIVTAAITWAAGFGNLGGVIFFGALVAVPEVCLYYFMDCPEDKNGRKIYLYIGLVVLVIITVLLVHFQRAW